MAGVKGRSGAKGPNAGSIKPGEVRNPGGMTAELRAKRDEATRMILEKATDVVKTLQGISEGKEPTPGQLKALELLLDRCVPKCAPEDREGNAVGNVVINTNCGG